MEAAAADALQILLAADRLLESAGPVGLAGLMLLLSLKAGPARPHELAKRLQSPPGRVRQRLLRLRRRTATRDLVLVSPDGRHGLSRKGHRFVNRIASLAYHGRPATPASQA
jgi:hypothetical protein